MKQFLLIVFLICSNSFANPFSSFFEPTTDQMKRELDRSIRDIEKNRKKVNESAMQHCKAALRSCLKKYKKSKVPLYKKKSKNRYVKIGHTLVGKHKPFRVIKVGGEYIKIRLKSNRSIAYINVTDLKNAQEAPMCISNFIDNCTTPIKN